MADKRWKATTAALLSPIFWLQGHIPNEKSLWELFTQDGTDSPNLGVWLMDYFKKWSPVKQTMLFALMSSLRRASDAAKSFELLKIARGQPRVAHVVKTCNTRETRVKIRVPTVIKTWGDAVRRESLGVRLGQSTVIGRVLRVGITGNSVCLAAYHR